MSNRPTREECARLVESSAEMCRYQRDGDVMREAARLLREAAERERGLVEALEEIERRGHTRQCQRDDFMHDRIGPPCGCTAGIALRALSRLDGSVRCVACGDSGSVPENPPSSWHQVPCPTCAPEGDDR